MRKLLLIRGVGHVYWYNTYGTFKIGIDKTEALYHGNNSDFVSPNDTVIYQNDIFTSENADKEFIHIVDQKLIKYLKVIPSATVEIDRVLSGRTLVYPTILLKFEYNDRNGQIGASLALNAKSDTTFKIIKSLDTAGLLDIESSVEFYNKMMSRYISRSAFGFVETDRTDSISDIVHKMIKDTFNKLSNALGDESKLAIELLRRD